MDIMSCSGPILFVGTKSTVSSTFLHGAYGPSALVKASNPKNIPKIHNGVYWHYIEGIFFGFTNDIEAIPNGELGTMDTDIGVFWRLDAPSDKNGYKKNLNIRKIFNLIPHKFEKFVYNCPGKKKRYTDEKEDRK
jgi:signal peptidase I